MTIERIVELLKIEHECMLRKSEDGCDRCEICDLVQDDKELNQMYTDAIALLKTQIPRVLSFDEARENAMRYMNPDSVKPLFIEFRIKDDDDEEGMRPPWRGGYNQRLMLINQRDRYGIDFRFWTDRPTDAQMEATPWHTD